MRTLLPGPACGLHRTAHLPYFNSMTTDEKSQWRSDADGEGIGNRQEQAEARKVRFGSGNTEIVAQINAAHVFVLDHLFGAAGHQNLTVMQDIGAINDFEGFAHVVIGY